MVVVVIMGVNGDDDVGGGHSNNDNGDDDIGGGHSDNYNSGDSSGGDHGGFSNGNTVMVSTKLFKTKWWTNNY